MDRYNTIILTAGEFGDNLYTELGHLLNILFCAGYVCVVREEEVGIVRVDFNYDVHYKFGNPIPVWCDEDELNLLLENDLNQDFYCTRCCNND